MGMGDQRHAPVALPPGKTQYPLYRRLGGAQGQSERVGKISPHWNSIPGPSNPQRVNIPTELSRTTIRNKLIIKGNHMENNVAFVHICLFVLAACSSETSICFYQITQRHIPEYSAKREYNSARNAANVRQLLLHKRCALSLTARLQAVLCKPKAFSSTRAMSV